MYFFSVSNPKCKSVRLKKQKCSSTKLLEDKRRKMNLKHLISLCVCCIILCLPMARELFISCKPALRTNLNTLAILALHLNTKFREFWQVNLFQLLKSTCCVTLMYDLNDHCTLNWISMFSIPHKLLLCWCFDSGNSKYLWDFVLGTRNRSEEPHNYVQVHSLDCL